MHSVTHQPEQSRFVVSLEQGDSVLVYQLSGAELRLTQTFVPPQLRRKGIAESLTRAALDFAQQNSFLVVPVCSYVQQFVEEHPEYQHLVTGPSGSD